MDEYRGSLGIIAEVKVVTHICYDSCRHCEHEEIQMPIQTAPMTKPVISGGLASAYSNDGVIILMEQAKKLISPIPF